MLIFEGRRVPKPFQNVVQEVFRFWITFLTVFGTILDPQMLAKWHPNDPQSPPRRRQGVTGIPQGATKVPRSAPGRYDGAFGSIEGSFLDTF